jgi:hypothetical protein
MYEYQRRREAGSAPELLPVASVLSRSGVTLSAPPRLAGARTGSALADLPSTSRQGERARSSPRASSSQPESAPRAEAIPFPAPYRRAAIFWLEATSPQDEPRPPPKTKPSLLLENGAHAPEALVAVVHPFIGAPEGVDLAQGAVERAADEACGGIMVLVSSAGGLFHDPIDDTEAE